METQILKLNEPYGLTRGLSPCEPGHGDCPHDSKHFSYFSIMMFESFT